MLLLAGALAAAALVPGRAAAQQTDSARAALWLRGACPGQEVQIATTAGERVRGYCGPIRARELTVSLVTRETTVPFTAVDSIWARRRGTARGLRIGAAAGALLGGAGGALIASALCERIDGCGSEAALGGLFGAAAGGATRALVGGAVGSRVRVWVRLYPR
jgi:hypothetical protein